MPMMNAEQYAWSVLRSDDITLNAIAGAIRSYHEEHHEPAFTLRMWQALTGV